MMRLLSSVKILIIMVFVLITFNLSGQSNVFYVSKTGNDLNDGTEASPWKTINKATASLVAGQTAYVRAGTYNEGVIFRNSGIAGQYVSLVAYSGERPVIEGAGLSTYSLVNLNGQSYVNFSGFRLQNGTVGISNGRSNIVIGNNEIFNFTNPGITLDNCSVALVKGNLTDNVVSSSWGECITFSQCEYIDIAYNEVRNSLTSTMGGEGIDVKGSKHIRVYGNVVHDLNHLGIYLDSYDGLDYDIEVFNNKVFNCTDGIVISAEQRNRVEKIRVYNNIVYDCRLFGIGIVNYPTHQENTGYPLNDVVIENNTIASVGGIKIDNKDGSNVTVRNNIIYGIPSAINISGTPAGMVLANNLSDQGTVSALGTGSIVADPMFVNPILKDFTLKSGSPAINTGFSNDLTFDYSLKSRPAGSGIDIGAYEYGSTSSKSITTVIKPEFSQIRNLIASGNDDGSENTSTGAVTLNSTSINIGFLSGSNKTIAALRFTNVNIPKGAKIINAYISLKASNVKSSDNDPIKIKAENVVNSAMLTPTSKNLSDRIRTTEFANWLPGSASVGEWKKSPSLDFIVTEVISQSGWTNGNAMTFLFEFNSTADASRSFEFNTFESGSANTPFLSVEYTGGVISDVQPEMVVPDKMVRIYPNPASDKITIDLNGNTFKELSVYDLSGKQIMRRIIGIETNSVEVICEEWRKGLYLVSLLGNNNISNHKVIVQ